MQVYARDLSPLTAMLSRPRFMRRSAKDAGSASLTGDPVFSCQESCRYSTHSRTVTSLDKFALRKEKSGWIPHRCYADCAIRDVCDMDDTSVSIEHYYFAVLVGRDVHPILERLHVFGINTSSIKAWYDSLTVARTRAIVPSTPHLAFEDCERIFCPSAGGKDAILVTWILISEGHHPVDIYTRVIQGYLCKNWRKLLQREAFSRRHPRIRISDPSEVPTILIRTTICDGIYLEKADSVALILS
jgi:hypothetical protein